MMSEQTRAELLAMGIQAHAMAPGRTIELALPISAVARCVLEVRAEMAGASVEAVMLAIIERACLDDLRASLHLMRAIDGAEVPPLPVGRREKKLYFVRRGQLGPIKIGVAEDVSARMRILATGSDEPLHLLAAVEQTQTLNESSVHKRFRELRKSGEWFEPHESLLAFIGSIGD